MHVNCHRKGHRDRATERISPWLCWLLYLQWTSQHKVLRLWMQYC